MTQKISIIFCIRESGAPTRIIIATAQKKTIKANKPSKEGHIEGVSACSLSSGSNCIIENWLRDMLKKIPR